MRLLTAALVIGFAAVVSVYKYIDISDAVSSLFSAPETLLLILSDIINRVFIFLPLFIFVISGTRNTAGFGSNAYICQKSRSGIVFNAVLKVLFYTVIFTAVLLIITISTVTAAFPQADDFTRAFFGAHASAGFGDDVLLGTPLSLTVKTVVTMCLSYFTIGITYMFLSFLLSEGAAFVLTVILGIGTELLGKFTASAIPLSLSATAVFILLSLLVMMRKDL
jgi:hypothetical protein